MEDILKYLIIPKRVNTEYKGDAKFRILLKSNTQPIYNR
jgi:hypothetical protein